MGYKEISIRIPVQAAPDAIEKEIQEQVRTQEFTYTIVQKSLDARNKNRISWEYRIGIHSEALTTGAAPTPPSLPVEHRLRKKQVVIVGSGPAGIFPALYLSECGYQVTLIERGSRVEQRKQSVEAFEAGGNFDPRNNYAFGEGGAGTFSDGKLTSRTKSIKAERNYIFQKFAEHGAPSEIMYMTHPHLGTDNLFRITQNMRQKLQDQGCTILFDCLLEDLLLENGRIKALKTSAGNVEGDYFVLATGHSAYETYRMLMNQGVAFQPKNFAIGFRAEHRQEVINTAQWGVARLPGVKAAEYRLTAEVPDSTPVYSFCMCPGGKVVPATAYAHTNVVNGMSYYKRNSPWANAAVVAGVQIEKLLQRPVNALETLNWLEQLEVSFYETVRGYKAPACTIRDFLNGKSGSALPASSYPFELVASNFSELLPKQLLLPLQQGLQQFCRKLRGYESGILLGLESKTSAPVQVVRHREQLHATFDNLFLAGEGSGWAGGITSSAADGLKIAQRIRALAE